MFCVVFLSQTWRSKELGRVERYINIAHSLQRSIINPEYTFHTHSLLPYSIKMLFNSAIVICIWGLISYSSAATLKRDTLASLTIFSYGSGDGGETRGDPVIFADGEFQTLQEYSPTDLPRVGVYWPKAFEFSNDEHEYYFRN